MDNFEKVQSLVFENKFNEVLDYINGIFNQEELENEEKIILLKEKERAENILGRENTSTLFELIKILIEENFFEESLSFLEKVNEEKIGNRKTIYLRHYIEASIGAGYLEKTSHYGNLYLQNLYSRKRFQEILNFLDKYQAGGGSKEVAREYEIRAVVGLGDIHYLDEKIFKEELGNFLNGTSRDEKSYQLFLDLVNEKRKYWKKSKSYHEIKIIHSWINRKKTILQKQLVNELFDRLVQFPLKKEWYLVALEFSKEFERKKLGLNVLEALESNKDELEVKLALTRKLKRIREDLEILPDIKEEDLEAGAMDLGTDLFKNESKEDNMFARIKKIERDIVFLKSTGSKTQLERLYEELKGLDERNDLLKDFYEKDSLGSGSKLVSSKKSFGKIEKELLDEISKYCSEDPNKELREKEGLIRGGKKYLELITEDDFKENIKDYYLAFFWMGLPELSLFAIERYLSIYINIPIKRFLDLNYLKIEALVELGEFYKASDLCDSLIHDKPMMDEEKINFVYLLGEISLKLNRKNKAHEAFSWVIARDPKYRLAKSRLKNIEQGQ